MSPFDPKNPPTPQTLTTREGVTVIVKPAPAPEPAREPVAQARYPSVVIRPPERPAHEGARDAFVRMLDAEHGKFIRDACFAEGDVNKESTKDLAQRVLVIAGEQFEKRDFATHGPPRNLRGWLFTLVRHEAGNHRRTWRLDIDAEADVDTAFTPAPDPEGTAQLAEHRAKLMGYLEHLPPEEKEVVLCADLYQLTIKETALAVGRSEAKVTWQLICAREKLEVLAAESARATAAGERRR
jgi:RNA polymerase sigma factor (sigma-70 family)